MTDDALLNSLFARADATYSAERERVQAHAQAQVHAN